MSAPDDLMSAPAFERGLRALATSLGRVPDDVRSEAAAYLNEMSASFDHRMTGAWQRFGRWMLRAHDLVVDDGRVAAIRELDREHSLVFLPAHRSYLDAWAYPEALISRGVSPIYSFGGNNINFFPLGSFASRTGMIFVRRATRELPVYRFVLRAYIAHLVQNRSNLAWSIEGGRTRTGKLRPPMYGILRYVVDAVHAADGPEVYVVPVSIQYDQLHEVGLMTAEARGGKKRPEDVRWLARLARQQSQRLGRTYVDFGEPLPLRERLETLGADGADGAEGRVVERLAVEISHRINRATPVTATAVVNLALLGADAALTLAEVLSTLRPLATYIEQRGWPVAGAADLTAPATIRRTLAELVGSGVLTCHDGGTEPVWAIGADQHLVAAFYRNSAIHILVDRAIAEVGLQAATEVGGDPRKVVLSEALRLRDLLKFEFFFSSREEFEAELVDEARLLGVDADALASATAEDAGPLLDRAEPLLAHLVLRPYLDSYLVVADRLAAQDGPVDEREFLAECVRVGEQWALQRRIASEESVSMELFRTALRMARHRGLVDEPSSAAARRDLHGEVLLACARVRRIADRAAAPRDGGVR
ncbi:lysophospholipid acyltransferase [Nocardioides limicola]|uniref:lysophospholipid acyltransferase n=1 Tax=Nocardioides limicola TaxID=2803368 RepID=UPI00193C4558|nr:lysophospholipid acyltransferase [Nocardioides sp. DJM-14]